MTEANRLRKAIARDNRSAYRAAKAAGSAYIINGNTIYRVYADGSRTAIAKTSSVMVKAKK